MGSYQAGHGARLEHDGNRGMVVQKIHDESGVAGRRISCQRFGERLRRFGRAEIFPAHSLLVWRAASQGKSLCVCGRLNCLPFAARSAIYQIADHYGKSPHLAELDVRAEMCFSNNESGGKTCSHFARICCFCRFVDDSRAVFSFLIN
jgi:hypothetical protein